MLTVDEVYERLLAVAPRVLESEILPLAQCDNRVLAEDVIADLDVPPHDNSAMDGYAVRSADITACGTRLRVSQRIPAGSMGTELEPGTAARIFTGAPVPPGADAVVMQEDTAADGDYVVINIVPPPGESVRKRGEDISAGKPILRAGHHLRPQELGLAASIGVAELTVFRRLRVATFSTGDELVLPGKPLGPGQIYNSNRYTMFGLLARMGCEVVDLGVVEDTLEATKAALTEAAAKADLILTSGGVSVGEEDHLKPAVESLGSLDLWRIAMKPGKPLAYGSVNGTPFIGLPGNPVSVFATFLLFARPFLRTMMGIERALPEAIRVEAGFDWPKPGKRQEYLRARLRRGGDGHAIATLYPHQGSGVLTSTVWADGLVIVPIGETVAIGDRVQYLPFGDLL
ncbi:MAG: molybdopterin molybdotransferase MoeA [Gammaproteobacteria bacterium]|nr:molybdopterin molybdotransferase MoeA [Gammaproteobacteria bacterium]MCP5138155.1 molybdopterin molybdotransferase MoeA [Gammaproteobacteria bacterium]